MDPEKVAAVFDATHTEFTLLAPYLWDPIGEASVRAGTTRRCSPPDSSSGRRPAYPAGREWYPGNLHRLLDGLLRS
ncbi:hypothetical protein [Planomonospora venezuelensis]|uniref:Uncharacterized protein n=1 Tax=Planomonospora venezuelensis TaxID=1999 RepID=A0A841DI00_PLAVE|nr:hypothetical protein [Planomonospora venezuelensis]MBB5967994.1 hypothetical protein [Planomonospora venezuelensis]GIN02466.1 hypothetical protein Pve01_41240 [Planomonospora venezuelensis]